MQEHHLSTPLSEEDINRINIGDIVYLSNKIITARDMAHLRLQNIYNSSLEFEEELKGCAIFHAGPVVKVDNNNYSIRAIGPTTSSRMEKYSGLVGELGIKAIIGKGGMGEYTTNMMKKYNMVYLTAAHGCATVHTKKVKRILRQHWMEEVGMPEAIWVMEFEELGPLVVGIDSKGNNLFEQVRRNAYKVIEELYAFDK